jgi:ankyrin repeat protein
MFRPALESDLVNTLATVLGHVSEGSKQQFVNAQNSFGTASLMWAAQAHRASLVSALCHAGASATQADQNGTTALHAVAGSFVPFASDFIHATLLIQLPGLQATRKNTMCSACVQQAAAITKKCQDIICTLLAAGAKVNQTAGESRITPLMNAAASANLAAVATLLAHGADATLTSAGASTAMHYACIATEASPLQNFNFPASSRSQLSCICAKCQSAQPATQTLTLMAAYQGNSACLSKVECCDCMSDPLVVDSSIAKAGILRLLLTDPNISPNAQDSQGFTPFLMCVWSGLPKLVRALAAHPRVDIHSSARGWGSYHVLGMDSSPASDFALSECLQALLSIYPAQSRSHSLRGIASAAFTRLVRLMVPSSTPLDPASRAIATGRGKRSPISLIAAAGRPETLKLLLSSGAADESCPDVVGRQSAMHYAVIGRRMAKYSGASATSTEKAAQALFHSFQHSLKLSASFCCEPYMQELITSWEPISVTEAQAMASTVIKLMKAGHDPFQRVSLSWPVADGLQRRQVIWSPYDCLHIGGLIPVMKAIHNERAWLRRSGPLASRKALRSDPSFYLLSSGHEGLISTAFDELPRGPSSLEATMLHLRASSKVFPE